MGFFTELLWLGDLPLAGKTILIYPEQGLGDFIQFCRYIPMFEARGAHARIMHVARTNEIQVTRKQASILAVGLSMEFHIFLRKDNQQELGKLHSELHVL